MVMTALSANEERPQHMKTDAEGMSGDLREYVDALEEDEERWAATRAAYEEAVEEARRSGKKVEGVKKPTFSGASAAAALRKLREPEETTSGPGKEKEKTTGGSKYNAVFNSTRAAQMYATMSRFREHFLQTDYMGPNFLSSRLNVHMGVSEEERD